MFAPNPILRFTFHASRIRHHVSRLALLSLFTLASLAALAQPANDFFTNAIPLQGPSGVIQGDNTGAQPNEPGEPFVPNTLPSGIGSSIWYSWVAPSSGPYTFSTLGSDALANGLTDTTLGVYTGNAVNQLAVVAQNDDIDPVNGIFLSSVTFFANAGTTYHIAADGYDGAQGAIQLNWGANQTFGGDFSFTSPLYILSDFDVFSGTLSPLPMDSPEPNPARATITRKGGVSGKVLIAYTLNTTLYTNYYITNFFGTNILATNTPISPPGPVFFTNIYSTNVAWTNYYEDYQYGQFGWFAFPGAYNHSCTNGTLFGTNAVGPFCSTIPITPPPTNYPCAEIDGVSFSTNFFVTNTTTTSTNISRIDLVTNLFCYQVIVITNVSTDPTFPGPINGVVAADDFQTGIEIPLPYSFSNPTFPPVNRVLVAHIDSVSLADGSDGSPPESSQIPPPTVGLLGSDTSYINILNLNAQGGTNRGNGFIFAGGEYFLTDNNGNLIAILPIAPGVGIIGTNTFNFERAVLTCSETIGNARVWVIRTGNLIGTTSASINYRIDFHPRFGNSANDVFREGVGVIPEPGDFSNPEMPLEPGSDYATPNDVAFFSPSPVDYTNVTGTLNFGPGVTQVPIDIPINYDPAVEFNEDLLLQLFDPQTDLNTHSLGFQRDCILTIRFKDQPAGACDLNYNPENDPNTSPPYNQVPGANASVLAMALQGDGKAVIGGNFSAYNATQRHFIARVNTDGSHDTTFNPGTGPDQPVHAIAIDGSGNIIIGGAFNYYSGTQRNNIARLHPNGTLDSSFNPVQGANGNIWALAVQSDGKILAVGEFTTFNLTNRNFIVRLNSDGSVDPTFDPGIGPDDQIFCMALQSDGRVIIGGEFAFVDGIGRNHIARLNADGSLDSTFDPGLGTDGIVYDLAVQGNNRILLAGAFGNVRGLSRKGICRLMTDGSMDNSFDPMSGADDTIYTVNLQPDGNILIGGLFRNYNQTRRVGVARLLTNGNVDTTFMDMAYNQYAGVPNHYYDPSVEPPNPILAMAVQADGSVLIGGNFHSVGGGGKRDARSVRYNVAKLVGGATPGPGNIQLAQNAYSVDKNGDLMFVTMTRTNGSLGPAAVTITPQVLPPGPGSAVAGDDFTFDPKGPVLANGLNNAEPTWITSWPPPPWSWQLQDAIYGKNNGASQTIVVPDPGWNVPFNKVAIGIIDNTNKAGNQGFNLVLSNPKQFDDFFLGGENIPTGVALGRSTAPATIIDNHVPAGILGFALTNFTVSESTKFANVTIIRTNGSSGAVDVLCYTTDGTAVAGRNYVSKSQTLHFPDSVSNVIFQVQILNDQIAEDDLTINLNLGNATGGALLGLTNATLTIVDANSPNGRLNFSSPAYSVLESGGTATVTVNRGAGSVGTVSVYCSATNGYATNSPAINGVNFTAVTNLLTWNSGDVAPKTFTVPILNNLLVDGNHTVNLRLFSPTLNGTTNYAILGGVSNSILTIVNDNQFGTLAFTRSNYNVMENGGPAVISVQRSSGIAQSISVHYDVGGGTANPGTDYTPASGILNFGPGEILKSFTVPINDNSVSNGATPRTIQLSLSSPSPTNTILGTLLESQISIIDDESIDQVPGSPDPGTDINFGVNADVFTLALQANGMFLAGGDFTVANGLIRNRIARFTPSGSIDASFSSPTQGVNDSVRALAVQSDSKILIGGFFTNVNGFALSRIARLNYAGSLDSTFGSGAGADNNVFALAETFSPADGSRKILVGGAFVNIGAVSRGRIARLNDNGTVDPSFAPSLGADGIVYAVVPYPTNSVRAGQVLIGGEFISVNGVTRNHVARLNADGSLDLTFIPPASLNDSVRALAIQADEKVLVGGLFTNVFNRIARLNADGSADPAFSPGVGANDTVSAIALQPDNKILLAGQFTLASGVTRHRITRLNTDGSVDPTINFGIGADNSASAVLVQPDDKILLGGGFTNFDGAAAPHLVRLNGRSINGSGTLEFDAPVYAVNEDGTNGFVTIRRRGGTSGCPTNNITVTLTTSNGTARAGVNFSNVNTVVSFPPGEVVRSIGIPVIRDFTVTTDLTANVFLSNPQPSGCPALGNQTAATLDIINVDSAISFSSPTYSINEDTSLHVATIGITRSGSTVGSASIDFMTTTNGTAVPGVNYTPTTNTMVFGPGQSNAFVQIPVIHDLTASGDKTVSLLLTNATGSLLLAPFQATLTIIDVERAPGVFFFSSTNYFASQATGSVTITVVRTNGLSGNVSIHFATADSNAIAGIDYVAASGSLSFSDHETVKSFTVAILDKPFVQNPRTFTVTLSGPTGGASIGNPSTVPVTILDYHVGLSFSSPAYAVSEDAGAVTISVLRLNGSNGPVSIQYATTNGTATAGVNYTTTAGTLNFANGESFKTFNVPVTQDHLITGNQTFGLSLFNLQPPTAAQLVTSNSTVTILDTTVGFLFSNAVYTVSKGGTNITLTVIRTNSALAGTNIVAFSTADGSATAGTDYGATSGWLIFTNGDVSKDITVPIVQNSLVEGDLFFTMSLITNTSSGGALLVNPSIATVNIIDNNSGFRFSSPNYSVNEGGVSATIPVLRSGVLTNTSTVAFSTSDGSAIAGTHYVATNGVLTYTNGEIVKYFTVRVIDETVIEGDHNLLLTLSNPTGNATLQTPSAAVLTIIDNDGSLIVPAGSALTSESGPVNGVIDTNETVTILLGLRNSVGSPTANLVATLLATNGVTPVTTSQSYGVLVPGGASASRPFTFTANGTNGQVITVTLRLTDGSSTNGFPGIAAFAFTLGSSTARYTNSGSITINDNTNASPYPSVMNVSGINGIVTKASVTLSNCSHTSAFDVDVLLSSPAGQNMLLMANAGGHTAFNRANFTFDDSASSYLSQSGPLTTGTNKPTAYLPIAPFPTPAPPAPYFTNLAACNNANPNGAWSLWVMDSRPLDTGGITNGWILALTTASVVQPNANVRVGLSAAPSPVVLGSNLVYTISVANYGPSTATGLTLTNFLPASANFISSSIGGYVLNGNALTFTNLGSLASGGSFSFNVTVRPTITGSMTDTVILAANEFDPYSGDNSASVATTVISPSADLSLSLSGTPDPATIGANITYSMFVSNGGPATATSVRVTNTLPASVTFVSASPGYSLNGNVVIFDLANLGTGTSSNSSVTVRANSIGTITDSASVGSTILDPFKVNNFASVKTDVLSVFLTVSRSGGNIIISWPAAASTYVLESSSGLNPAAWSQVTSPPIQVVGDQNVITIPVTNASRLFRLRAPAP